MYGLTTLKLRSKGRVYLMIDKLLDRNNLMLFNVRILYTWILIFNWLLLWHNQITNITLLTTKCHEEQIHTIHYIPSESNVFFVNNYNINSTIILTKWKCLWQAWCVYCVSFNCPATRSTSVQTDLRRQNVLGCRRLCSIILGCGSCSFREGKGSFIFKLCLYIDTLKAGHGHNNI